MEIRFNLNSYTSVEMYVFFILNNKYWNVALLQSILKILGLTYQVCKKAR